MKQEDFIKFCYILMLRDIEIAQTDNYLNFALEATVRGMFFRQGLCNSNQHTGVFNDQYQRCARIKDPEHSLLYKVTEGLSKKFADNKTYLIPVSDYELAVIVCSANNPLLNTIFHCNVINVQIGEREILCIQTTFRNDVDKTGKLIFDLLTFIAHWGILATQDTLIRILLALEIKRYGYTKNLELESSLVAQNAKTDMSDILKLLRQAPLTVENLKNNDAKCYKFYCNYLEKLIQSLYNHLSEQKRLTLTEQRLVQQAYVRLHLKLLMMQDRGSDYKQRMTAIEFGFDELVNILSIARLYNKDDLFNSIKHFVCKNVDLSKQEMPVYVSLAGSCMQLIHRGILSTMKYFAANDFNKELRVYISKDIYYEVCQSYGVPQDFKNDQYVTFSDMRFKSIDTYTEQIVDLMLLHFHANVNRKQRGFCGHNVQAIIQRQIELREFKQDSGQLIVILDVALTNLSDVHIKQLIVCFARHILEGKLAIIMTTSLNKYCQNGFDRFPSGLSAIFYTPENFPHLSPGNELVGFEEYDVIPQTVAHCLRYAGSSMLMFYRMVHENSRYLHDNIVPKHLYDDDQPIHIDCPYSNDEYRRPWGFMVVRFANEEIANEYRSKLQLVLDNIGFEYRNGFGFNRSTYAFIGENLEILRISVGPNASVEQYQKLVDFIVLQNENICRDAMTINRTKVQF